MWEHKSEQTWKGMPAIAGPGGSIAVGDYSRGKFLSKGAFGQAFLARCNKSHKEFVVKMVDISRCDEKERVAARKECAILGSLRHPNVIEYRESFEEKGQLCIVMAYADGGDLTGRLKAQRGKLLPEDRIADWFVQICLALKHLHDRKILHRDLKSQNIFLSGRKELIKLGDFGIARVLKHTNEHARTAIGTPYYLSPEICEGKAYNNKSDIWSLGVVLYEMCTLKCPFDAKNLNGLVLKIIRAVFEPVPLHLSSACRELVSTLLKKDPKTRPNINQVLRMPYIQARISSFLDESLRQEEFSHTVLHGRNPLPPSETQPKRREATPPSAPKSEVSSWTPTPNALKKEEPKQVPPMRSSPPTRGGGGVYRCGCAIALGKCGHERAREVWFDCMQAYTHACDHVPLRTHLGVKVPGSGSSALFVHLYIQVLPLSWTDAGQLTGACAGAAPR